MQVHVNIRIIYVLCVDIVLYVFMCVYCGCKYQTIEQCHCEVMNTQNHIPCILFGQVFCKVRFHFMIFTEKINPSIWEKSSFLETSAANI